MLPDLMYAPMDKRKTAWEEDLGLNGRQYFFYSTISGLKLVNSTSLCAL